jgi:hypothetical protein
MFAPIANLAHLWNNPSSLVLLVPFLVPTQTFSNPFFQAHTNGLLLNSALAASPLATCRSAARGLLCTDLSRLESFSFCSLLAALASRAGQYRFCPIEPDCAAAAGVQTFAPIANLAHLHWDLSGFPFLTAETAFAPSFPPCRADA